jgi:hypothetical protein
MSAFYDQASLVVVPSGYKSGKIYAQKPLTTDGQLTFTRASTATRVNASGLIEEVASGVPRLDYTNSSCPKLLLEPQRTNVVTYSQQFEHPDWSAANITVTANAIASPDGTTNADKIESTTTVNSYVNQSTSNVGAYTHSVYAKAGNVSSFTILWASYNGGKAATFNLSNGTATTEGATVSATITNVGNGWYRCTTTDTSANYIVLISLNNVSNTAISIGSYIYLWGAQAESGAYATSYIPTTSAAVTRVADAAEKTGISSLIGQTEGVLFVDFQINSFDQLAKWIAFLGGGSTYVGIFTSTTNFFNLEVFNVSTQAINTTAGFVVGQRYKIAIAYKANDFAFYVNGVQVGTDNSGTVPTMSEFKLQYNTTANNLTARTYNQALLFKTRLTNAQLAELTTL